MNIALQIPDDDVGRNYAGLQMPPHAPLNLTRKDRASNLDSNCASESSNEAKCRSGHCDHLEGHGGLQSWKQGICQHGITTSIRLLTDQRRLE